jgi:surface antigen
MKSKTLSRLLAIAVLSLSAMALGSGLANASQTDCLSYSYACTPGYTGANASGTWAWDYYGGKWAKTANGYHNCTLYAAWRLQQNGLRNPGRSWGNAVDWAGKIGGGNHTPTVGSIAWWGKEAGGGFGHVAYVEKVSGSRVYVRADNFPGSSSGNGYTSAGWIAANSVDLFLHPHNASR